MSLLHLEWRRFTSFLQLREDFRDQPCIYLQTDPQERVLRIGETKDLWGSRYRGGTAYALEAAAHGSGNLFFAAPAPVEETERTALEATLIYDLQPQYNNEHKKYPSLRRVEYIHGGEPPSALRLST